MDIYGVEYVCNEIYYMCKGDYPLKEATFGFIKVKTHTQTYIYNTFT